MNRKITLVFLVLTIALCGIMASSQLAMGEETVSDHMIKDVGATSNNTTEEKTTLESMVEGLFERIFGIIGDVIDFIFMVITAPFRAWANVWTGWGSSLGSWYGPLLATGIILGVVAMWRFWNYMDKKLAKH
ncbi:MAG: hypothetical protein DRP30_04575 [Thermotoga sp.]|nr:MAG: hypothetical protein DRP30_04575 [Thermotoga sp.]